MTTRRKVLYGVGMVLAMLALVAAAPGASKVEYVSSVTLVGTGQDGVFMHGLGARPLHVLVWVAAAVKGPSPDKRAAGPEYVMTPHTDWDQGRVTFTVLEDRVIVHNGSTTDAAWVQVVAW